MAMGKLYMILFYVAHFVLFLSIFFAIIEKKMLLLEKKYQKWLYLILCYFIFMLTNGIISGYDFKFISRDIWPFSFFSALLIAGDKDRWKIIDKMIYFHFIGVIIVIGIIWEKYGLDIGRNFMTHIALSDESPSLYFAWQLLFAWPYMLLKYKAVTFGRKLVTLIGIGLFFLLGIIFLKRIIIFMIGILVLLIMYNKIFFHLKSRKFSTKTFIKKIATSVGIILIILVIFQTITQVSRRTGVPITEAFIQRILGSDGNSIDTVLEDDRFSGAGKEVYMQANFFEFFVGQGFGSTVQRDGEQIWSVESALGTFFLKGGIFYVLLWYCILFMIFADFLKNKKKSEIIFQILIIIPIFLSPIHYFFIMNLLTGYTMLYLGRCMTRIDEKNQIHMIHNKILTTVKK